MKRFYRIVAFIFNFPVLIVLGLGPYVPLFVSFHSDWWEAKVYGFIFVLSHIINRMMSSPGLACERTLFILHKDAKSWDKLLAPLVAVSAALVPLVAGLDFLYKWSPEFSMPFKIASLFLILAGLFVLSYALITNRFFSSVVRIQNDRGHQVVSHGPYRWIRHPGYSASLLTFLATPFFLDSRVSILPAILFSVLLLIRTDLEDKTLQAELNGYVEYAKQVRYRLLPGVW